MKGLTVMEVLATRSFRNLVWTICSLSLSVILAVSIPSQAEGHRGDRGMNSTRLKQLSGAEIRAALSGTRAKSGNDDPPSYEEFRANGDWISWRGGRSVRMQHGRWFIRSMTLCVMPKDQRADCRSVWRGSHDKRIYMRRPLSWDTGKQPAWFRLTDLPS